MSAECGLLSHRLQAKLAVTTGENMKLNEKLVSLRKAQKLNQAQAAEALNVSRQAISTWETGAVLPSADSLKALSRLYIICKTITGPCRKPWLLKRRSGNKKNRPRNQNMRIQTVK